MPQPQIKSRLTNCSQIWWQLARDESGIENLRHDNQSVLSRCTELDTSIQGVGHEVAPGFGVEAYDLNLDLMLLQGVIGSDHHHFGPDIDDVERWLYF